MFGPNYHETRKADYSWTCMVCGDELDVSLFCGTCGTQHFRHDDASDPENLGSLDYIEQECTHENAGILIEDGTSWIFCYDCRKKISLWEGQW